MSKIILAKSSSAPTTVASGTVALYVDSNGQLHVLNDSLTDANIGPPESWSNLTYNTGWEDHSTARYSVGYRKHNGMVELRGTCKRTSGSSATIGTLPAGYRPAKQVGIGITTWAFSGGTVAATLDITTAGVVSLVSPYQAEMVMLDGVWFSLA